MATGTLPDARALTDELAQKTAQLHALLQMTFGNASEEFNCMNVKLRDNYLWVCATMARDCEDLASALGPAMCRLEGASHV